ncbi:hypothetical protein PRIC1_007282 [Phytophthora ramorum]
MAEVLSGGQPCALDLEMDISSVSDDSRSVGVDEVNADVSEAVHLFKEAVVTPPIEMLHEAALRGGINTILDKTVGDEDELACIREICIETLARMDRVTAAKLVARYEGCQPDAPGGVDVAASGKTSAVLTAPKSPQERLIALGKTRLSRRPSFDSFTTGEKPRWKIIDGNEDPIMDLTVMFRGDSVPVGFTKLERTPSGQRADLNKGGRGTFVYLCQSKDQSSGKAPISEIIAIFPERGEFVPSDYEVIRRRGIPANINTGTQGEKIYLCFKRSATSAIVDLVVLFPKKNETLPYGFMKVDKSPLGHVADLNSTSGGTEVFLGYKKKVSCISDLHKLWLFASVTPPQVLERGSQRNPRSPPPSTGKLQQLRSAFSLKATEVREQELLVEPSLPSPDVTTDQTAKAKDIGWKETIEYYMYPLLLGCYTRHGTAAEAAISGLSNCLDEGIFDVPGSDLCRLDVVIDAVASVCQQGVKSRFEPSLQFFQKVIRKCSDGFDPSVLHTILKALTFIGDFDGTLAKPFEDELVSKIMSAYEASLASADSVTAMSNDPKPEQSSDKLARELVVDLVDDISTGAEIATITDNMLGVFKSHLSIQSLTFCRDITAAMASYANSTAEKNALQLVVTFSRAINRKFVGLGETSTESDQCSSVSSLRALNQTLLVAGTRARDQRVFGQVVRRFVLSTLNSTVLTWLPGIFRASLTLISTLWNHYRRYLKVELALIFEHVLLRILRATAPCAKDHQMEIMHEMTMWLQLPHNVVEIFLNFDLDRIQQWKIFEHLCSTLGSIGEGNIGHIASAEEGDDSALQLQNQAISTILAMARSAMDASGHAHLISRDQRTRMLSMDNGGWEQDESTEEASPMKAVLTSPSNGESNDKQVSQPSSPTGAKHHSELRRQSNRKYGGNISVRMRNELQKHNQQLLKRAMEISSSKSLKKALEYLVAMNFIKDTARSVTSFLRIYHDFFDETEIGDYLGEGDEDFKVQRFLEEIYDDIAHNPMHIKGSRVIPKATREASVTAADLENEKFRGGIAKAVAQSEELMKDLSHAYNTFQFVGVDTPISPDLIKILFERVWFSLLTLSTTILCDNQSDLSTRMQCLDLLRFGISTCLFLSMPVERQAFCGLLRKVQDSLDGAHEEEGEEDSVDNTTTSTPEDTKYDWVRTIEEAAGSDDPWKAMGDIHLLVNDMKETIQVRQKSEKLDSVIQRIHRGHFYLKNSTTFIHEGDLTKKCRSRHQLYRFFLFNDQLLYADKSMSGRWSPHNFLRLKLTRISNIPDGVMSKNAFQIQNPIKSFVVFADSAGAKAEWMRLIDEAIAEASKKINRTARRISTHGLGDARSSLAASTASSARKVFMRFSSPMTSPTAERDSTNTSSASEGDSPVKPVRSGNSSSTNHTAANVDEATESTRDGQVEVNSTATESGQQRELKADINSKEDAANIVEIEDKTLY